MSRPAMRVLTIDGPMWLSRLSDYEASIVGAHWNAIRHYIETGADDYLSDFDGETVCGHDLETRTVAVEWWAVRGELDFEDIYEGSR